MKVLNKFYRHRYVLEGSPLVFSSGVEVVGPPSLEIMSDFQFQSTNLLSSI